MVKITVLDDYQGVVTRLGSARRSGLKAAR
jgi:hypothetical protein